MIIYLTVSTRKEIDMEEPMTDYQFKTILKIILDILDSSENIEEAREKIRKLLEDEQSNK